MSRGIIPEIEDLKRTFIRHPSMQHKVRFSASEAAGSVELGWHRGKQAGIHEAHLSLLKKFPLAAKYLLKKYRMNTDGTITL